MTRAQARQTQFLPVCLIGAAFAVALALNLALTSCGGPPKTGVLFVGNSFTYFNNGLDTQLGHLAPSIKASRIAPGGYTLEMHWNDGNAVRSIRDGHWAYVVLQEQSQRPVLDQAKFRDYVKAFDQEIRQSGGQTILLMTWERPDSVGYGVTTANLAAAYDAVGAELGIKVAPVGVAFARALAERPDLVLCSADGHPTVYGTYLAACVVYGTILGRSPVGLTYADKNISADVRDFLQRIADESLVK